MGRGKSLPPAIGAQVAEILSTARSVGKAELAAWRKPEADFRELVRCDYAPFLRRNLPQRRLEALKDAAIQVWPGFNERPLSGDLAGIRGIASNLRVHFKASPFRGIEGLALRGFYADPTMAVLKHPLIYVNTAHHALAVSATFCHEVGHHLSAQVSGRHHRGVHFFFDADYAAHLEDPEELAADTMVSIAAYPKALAMRLFSEPVGIRKFVARKESLTGEAFGLVREHFKERYGFDFPKRLSPVRGLRYLSGMIHYAKLRSALLSEYKI